MKSATRGVGEICHTGAMNTHRVAARRGVVVRLFAAFLLVAACASCSFGASEEDCSTGTVLSNGVCVSKTSPTGEPTITSLTIQQLIISEEKVRPLYLMHPMTVRVGLLINAEPFKTDLIIGLSSKDGSKHCAAGYIELEYAGGAEAGEITAGKTPVPKESTWGELVLERRLFVQPRCKNLVGEKGAKVWVAIDPFRRTYIPVDPRPGGGKKPEKIEDVDVFIHTARWPLDQCKSSYASGHFNSCESTFDVADTPGLDVRMEKVQSGSSVLFVRPTKPDDADLFVNTASVIYGTEQSEKDDEGPLAAQNMRYYFMLRPDVAPTDLPAGVSAASLDWEPLIIAEKDVQKCPTCEPDLKQALHRFLSSLKAATKRLTDHPLMIPPGLRTRLTKGDWTTYSKFELLGCALPAFQEAQGKDLGANNNCSIMPLIVTKHTLSDGTPLGGHHAQYEVKATTTEKDKQGNDKQVTKTFEYLWAKDPKDSANRCGDKDELRPECVELGQHNEETTCYLIPAFKTQPVTASKCHCCYAEDAFDEHIYWQHEPEISFTMGSAEDIGLRSALWWKMRLYNKSLLERDPIKLQAGVGFSTSIVGWWPRGMLYIDLPVQLGIGNGYDTYWWPDIRIIGFSIWDKQYVLEEEDLTYDILPLAAKEWTETFCKTLCMSVVCFDVCCEVGASVSFATTAVINVKEKAVKGRLEPKIAGIFGGSVGLNLFIGVIGVEVIFKEFIAFSTPVEFVAQFILVKSADPLTLTVKGRAAYMLALNVLDGAVGGFWKPVWGGKDQLEFYAWDGLKYIWTLWAAEKDWTFKF